MPRRSVRNFGTPSFRGVNVRTGTTAERAARLVVDLRTGKELQNFIRQGRYMIPGMAQAMNEAHAQMGYIVQHSMYSALTRSMREHSPRRADRPTRTLRRALMGDTPIYVVRPAGRGRGAGFTVDVDEQLNRLVRDERGKPYWRAVNFGYSRVAVGHLFFSNPVLGGAGTYSFPFQRPSARLFSMVGGADPRMPKVRGVEWTRFTYQFEGYNFVQEGFRVARRRISREAEDLYLENLEQFRALPDAMRLALRFFAGGGRGRRLQGPGGRFISDPRR